MKNKTADILVIDDEKVIIDAVTKICSLENYSVDSAYNVKSAIELISKYYYPIIICDIMMPDGDGFQILDEVQAKSKDSAIIMMTGYSTVENAVNSLYYGAMDFIPKPFTVDELLGSVYRTNKYQQIKKKQISSSNNKTEIFYVDCPAKYYRLGHSSWLCEERDGSVLIGVCDMFLKTIETITELEFLEIEEELAQGICCLTVKSAEDRMHKVLSPVSGRIIEINENLKSNINLIEKDPYFEGWVYRVIPNDLGYEVKHLVPCSSDRPQIRI
ncbi:MAG: response regulator [Ignavibacteriaceae bacterium]|nr:response regulator [Ignavibacteriaceae bacterium]